MIRILPALVGLFSGLLVCSVPAQLAAQAPQTNAHATRASLEQLLASYEHRGQAGSAEHPGLSPADAAAIRARLEQGDFQSGDEIHLFVEGYPELTGTFTVDPTRTITVPNVGRVPLHGVLRSELQGHLSEQLAQYVRDPRVRAESTIRILVLGAVGKPGFYSVSPNAQVTEVITLAGGTGGSSALTRMRIERDGRQVIANRALQEAVIAGRSLDQLNVRAGDRLIVPERGGHRTREILAWTGTLLSLTWLVLRIAD